MSTDLEPYRIDIPQAQLDDLARRLRATRWPERETVHDWSQGLPLAYAKELCAYWADSYDWRRFEAELNALPQFRTDLEGLPIHLLHLRSPHEGALPLLLTHGWPGSVVEFVDVLGALTDPPDPADAFHVVCPTLPGYGFSGKPTGPGWNVARIARAWAALMDRLGYGRYAAQGGDWGAMVTAALGSQDAAHLAGIHLTMPVAPPGDPALLSAEDQQRVAAIQRMRSDGSGYARQQATRPQTLGYGLLDSPAGQCAWIVEKFREWSDCDGHPENAIARDRLLDNVMLYWLPGAAASSARLYWESYLRAPLDPVPVPTGVTLFPKELLRMPRAWVERRFTDLRYWSEPARGGHFASLEQPETYVAELRAFFRTVR